MRQLFYLDLSHNQFQGQLPSDFVELLVSLRILYLSNNNLSGDLPEDLPFLGEGRMKQLYINNNAFTGEFPGEGWDPINLSKSWA